jgi:hypothetical protein
MEATEVVTEAKKDTYALYFSCDSPNNYIVTRQMRSKAD